MERDRERTIDIGELLERCREGPSRECIELVDRFLEENSSFFEKSRTGVSRDLRTRYRWVERIIERGLPDGRKRFILKVLTPYLVNILSLGDEEAFERLREFIDNSCKNYGNCEKIYDSWLRGDIRRVRSKGLRPAKLDSLDEDLRRIIEEVLSST